MSVKERIKDFVKSQDLSISAFEKSIEASNGYVNSISKSVGLDKILKIIEVYPSINLNWLITGEGNMMINDIIVSEPGFIYQSANEDDATPLYDEEEVEEFTNKNGNKFYIYGDGSIDIEVPKLTEPAYASYLETFDDSRHEVELKKAKFPVDKIGKGNYMAFTIKNNSMWNGGGYDTPGGAEILGREVGKHLWQGGFRKTDYGFILLTKQGIYHKDISGFNPETGMLALSSRNPEVKDFELNIDDVYQVFNVIKRSY